MMPSHGKSHFRLVQRKGYFGTGGAVVHLGASGQPTLEIIAVFPDVV